MYTIIIASNQAGEPLRFRITHSWVKALGFLAFGFVIFVVTAAIDYSGLLHVRRENSTLLAENYGLRTRGAYIRHQLETRATDLAKYKVMMDKLKIITGDPDSLDHPVGGPVARQPASLPSFSSVPLLELAERTQAESQKREQEMLSTWDLLSERRTVLSATPTIKPTQGYYSSPFGYRIDPINGRSLLHAGVDIAANYGTQVLAPADGVVTFAGYENGYGNLVSIDHGFGVLTRYGHNSKLFVHAGQKVHRFDVISAVGSTGHSTGSHLHYEVIHHGIPVDPINYILREN